MPGSDTTPFTIATGATTRDDTFLTPGETLMAFSITLAAGDPPIHVRGSVMYGTHGHILINGWVRGSSDDSSMTGLYWTGALPIVGGSPTPTIQVRGRNDTGSTVTVTYNWVTI